MAELTCPKCSKQSLVFIDDVSNWMNSTRSMKCRECCQYYIYKERKSKDGYWESKERDGKTDHYHYIRMIILEEITKEDAEAKKVMEEENKLINKKKRK